MNSGQIDYLPDKENYKLKVIKEERDLKN